MKKNIMAVCALMFGIAASAQDAYDVSRVLGNNLNGTARFVGMGGAMSALGGDISVMGTNPAGIGIYRRNDFSVSVGFNNTATESNFNGNGMKEDRTKASFDQIGFENFFDRIRAIEFCRRVHPRSFNQTEDQSIVFLRFFQDFNTDMFAFDPARHLQIVGSQIIQHQRHPVQTGCLFHHPATDNISGVREETVCKFMFALIGKIVRMFR